MFRIYHLLLSLSIITIAHGASDKEQRRELKKERQEFIKKMCPRFNKKIQHEDKSISECGMLNYVHKASSHSYEMKFPTVTLQGCVEIFENNPYYRNGKTLSLICSPSEKTGLLPAQLVIGFIYGEDKNANFEALRKIVKTLTSKEKLDQSDPIKALAESQPSEESSAITLTYEIILLDDAWFDKNTEKKKYSVSSVDQLPKVVSVDTRLLKEWRLFTSQFPDKD
jgi:hypothetical protein